MIFEPNQGQTDSSVKFLARGAAYSLFLDSTGAVLTTRTARPLVPGESAPGRSLESLRMTLVGANPAAAVAGSDRLPGKTNYFIGNDPKQWRTGVPQFAGVHYESVYPGIDLVFYGNQGRLEYDFKIAPGADPTQAELQFDGAAKLELSNGDLILTGSGGDLRLQAPRVYQRAGDEQQSVEGRFVLRAANRVGFEIGAYDRGRELVIDPILSYSTYFGGGGADTSPSIAVNGDGFIYLSGSTTSGSPSTLPGLPVTSNAYQSTLNGAQNIFILKLDPTAGEAGVVYLTYLGGSGIDTSAGLAVDPGGNAYVAGTTTSPNFPTVGGYQSAPETGSTGAPCFPNESVPCHVFVSKLSGLDNLTTPPSLSYSTYLSGNGTDIASGLAIDSNADVFITGTTTSSDVGSLSDVFPASFLPTPFQQSPSQGSTIQFFVTEVNTKTIGTASVPYSTYFGGATGTVAVGGGIAVDSVGNVYFSGTTNFFNSGESVSHAGGLEGTDFPILNAYQPCLDTPPPTTITYPVGCTEPTTSPIATDAFIAKLNPAAAQTSGAQLLFSSYLGGSGDDTGPALAIDNGAANVYLTGSTNSSDFVFPLSIGAFQTCLDTPLNPAAGTACPAIGGSPVPTDAYVARFPNLTPTVGSTGVLNLAYFSYLGGTGNDSGLAITADPAQGALITGSTSSGVEGVFNQAIDFPVSAGPIQSVLNGTQNAFFARIYTATVSGQGAVGSYVTYFGGNGVDRGTSITLDSSLNTYFAGDTTSTNLETVNPLQPNISVAPDTFAVKLQSESSLCIGPPNCPAVVVSPTGGAVAAGTGVTMTFTVTNLGPDLATDITVIGQLNFGSSINSTATLGTATAGSGTCSAPLGSTVSCVIPTLQAGSISSVVMVVTPNGIGNGSLQATVSNPNNTSTQNVATATFEATNFSASILPSSATVVAGSTAHYSVDVNASPGFGANVSFQCSSLPVGASCGFQPATLSFNGSNNQSSALSVTTTARPPTTITSTKSRGPVYALWLMAPGLALLSLGSRKRRRNRLLGFLALSTLFALVVLLPACSHTKEQPVVSGTPAGTYPLTVTATSGTNSQSIGFTLTVQ
jgi:hypothetical protein